MRRSSEGFAARTLNSSRLFIATVGAGPSRTRGVCGVIATAWNGDAEPGEQASHVPRVARYRFSHPSRVPLRSGVPLSM
jgi:hypothetical protein